MRKTVIKILLCVLALVMAFGLASCKKGEWKGTNMTNWGQDVSSGGFIAETSNYLYYINGYASYGDDNEFGKPVKGSLMAVEKSSIKSGELKTEIVVPKLFVSNDYNAGVFVYDGYVYYGTPSTDKTGSGEIAISQMTFTKTKLDGSDTQTFFTVSSHSTEFRFVKENGKVFLLYYDLDDKAIYLYDTTNKSRTTIAKNDSKIKDKYESLDKVFFLESQADESVKVIFSATVYSENYYPAADTGDDYSRATAVYNKVYAYSIGDGVEDGNEFYGKCILDGEANDITYTPESVKYGAEDNFLFYSQTTLTGKTTRYAVVIGEFNQNNTHEILLNGITLDSALVVGLDEVYAVVEGVESTEENTVFYIVKTTMLEKDTQARIKIAEVGQSAKLYQKRVENGKDYLYYFNSINHFVRIEIISANDVNTEFNNEERISEDSVATAWYKPEFITIDGVEYVFYNDNTAKGSSYIKFVKLTGATLQAEDTDDDGEDDVFYFEGHKFLGKITDFDAATMAKVDLNKVGTITYDKEDGTFGYEEEIVAARAAYNALSDAAKESYGDSYDKLCDVEKALAAAKLAYKLDGIIDYEICDQATKDAYKDAYNQAKATMEEIKLDTDVLSYLDNNMKYNYYVKATKLFA